MKTNITASRGNRLSGLLALRLFAAYEFWGIGHAEMERRKLVAEINDQFQPGLRAAARQHELELAMWAELVFRFAAFRISDPPVRP